MSQIQVHISKEHADQVGAVRKAFDNLPVNVSADHWRLSEGDLAMQITIFLSNIILGGAAWDLLKASIRKLRSQYSDAGIVIRDKNSIQYAIKPNEDIVVIVVPDRRQEFAHIKTLDDLIESLAHSMSAWNEVQLSSLIKNLNAGVSVNSTDKKYSESCSYILKTSAIQAGVFNSAEKKIVDEKDLSRASVNPQAGQILISRMNTPKLVGETAYISKTYPHIFLPDRIWQTEFYGNADVDTHWLAYLFQSGFYSHKIKSLGTGTSGSMKNISKKDFLSLKVNLPSLPEQKRIVAVLETWDKAIDLLEKKIELKEQLKKGFMQQLLTGKKRLPGFSEKWKYKRLDEMAEMGSGGTPKSTVEEYYINGNIPWLKSGEVRKGRIWHFNNYVTEEGLKNSSAKMLPKKTVLIAMYGATAGQVGILEEQASTNQAVCSLIANDQNDPDFLYFLLSTKTENFILLGSGAAQPNISQTILRNFDLLMPNKNEQKDIVKILSSAEKELVLLENKLQEFKKQKKYLLNNLVTGKIRTPEDMKIHVE